MPRRRGDGLGHAKARRRAQEAAVPGLVADAVTEAHEAHAAAQHDPGGQCEGFPQRGRPPGRPRPESSRGPYAAPGDAPDRERCPAGAHQPRGGPLRALDEVAHVQPVRPALSMGDTLQLTGPRSAMSLHSSAAPGTRPRT